MIFNDFDRFSMLLNKLLFEFQQFSKQFKRISLNQPMQINQKQPESSEIIENQRKPSEINGNQQK